MCDFLMDGLGLGKTGWAALTFVHSDEVKGGYSGQSTGPGLLSVQPRPNRFGDEFLLNQIGLVIQKPLRQDQFDSGFNGR